MPETWVSVDEISKMLQVPPKWVYKKALALRNPLPSYKIYGKRRFVIEEVQQWVRDYNDIDREHRS